MRLSLSRSLLALAATALPFAAAAGERLIESKSLNPCMSNSSFSATLFNVVFTPNNRSLAFDIEGISNIAGKVEADLGTFGRVAATLVGRRRAAGWAGAPGVRGRVAAYLRHDALGAELLEDAGADLLTVAWAREHHRPERDWTVPLEVGRALRAADDD